MREGLVYYKDMLAGTILENDDGIFHFTYDDAYLSSSAPAISVTLPKTQKSYHKNQLFGFFDGLIPEGWLLDIITHNFDIKAKDRMGLLLTTCADAIGAVSIIPTAKTLKKIPRAKPSKATETKPIQLKQSQQDKNQGKCLVCTQPLERKTDNYHSNCIKSLFGVRQELLSNDFIDLQLENIEALAHENINRKLALTGAQQKISVSFNPVKTAMRLTVFSDNGLFILKPPPEKFPDFPIIEHASMLIARNLGLTTANFGLIPFASGALGYITRRFDRHFAANNPGNIKKYAMEDFGQIFNRNIDADKYRGSYNQVAKWLKGHAKIPGEAGVRFLSQIYLAFLIGNNDLHLKNIAVLTDNGVSLSPIFDFVSTQLIDDEPEIELTLPINGRDRKLRRKDWLTLGKDLGLTNTATENIINYFEKKYPLIEATIKQSFMGEAYQTKLIEFIKKRMSQIN